jgi:hypothetical protein
MQIGLYTSFVGFLIYFLFGTARDNTVGPTAIMSLMVASEALSDDGTTSLPVSVFLACFVGLIQAGMGLLGLGMSTEFENTSSYRRVAEQSPTLALTCDVPQVSFWTLSPSLLCLHSRLQLRLSLVHHNSRCV